MSGIRLVEIQLGHPAGQSGQQSNGRYRRPPPIAVLHVTGETFNGKQAAEMGLVNKSVPLAELRAEVEKLCHTLLEKEIGWYRYAKNGFKRCRELTWDQNEDYLYAKLDQALFRDPERWPRRRYAPILG